MMCSNLWDGDTLKAGLVPFALTRDPKIVFTLQAKPDLQRNAELAGPVGRS